MDSKPINRFSTSQILLAVAAFLIPIVGGQISSEQGPPIEPGFGALLRSMLGGAFLAGMETPTLSHFLLGALVAGAMLAILLKRSVLQLPNIALAGSFVAFFGLLTVSLGLSSFKFTSLAVLSEWLVYALAFFTVVTAAGRQSGPKLILGALFAGCALIAIYGIRFEYWPASATEPTYRIFAGWVNPNAIAGILVVGFLIGLSLMTTLERGPAVVVGFANVLVGIATFLTGSKAGFGALAVGILVFGLLVLIFSKSNQARVKHVVLAGIVVALSFLLFTAILKTASKTDGKPNAPGLGRITAYSEAADQSWTFRKNLWKGSAQASLKHPTGYGIGTYIYEGSRSGLTTPTVLTHNTLLQLLFESSALAVLAFLAILGLWLVLVFRGTRRMPEEPNLLRFGIVAAVAATMAHGVFESNLYYFGIGLTFFILLGVGLNLSADSVAPEFTPRGVRMSLSLLALLPVLALFYCGYAEWTKARIKFFSATNSPREAEAMANGLVGFAPMDGEAWYLLHRVSRSPSLEAIQRASQLSPSPKVMRRLAEVYLSRQETASARGALHEALVHDPNNLLALRLDLKILTESGNIDEAKKVARRMVDIEATPYFQIRALAPLVETETCEARMFLAQHESSPKAKADLLQGALDIYRKYATVTVPEVKKFGPTGSYAGQDFERAATKCNTGIEVANQLATLYRALGDEPKAVEAVEAVDVFKAALEVLGAK